MSTIEFRYTTSNFNNPAQRENINLEMDDAGVVTETRRVKIQDDDWQPSPSGEYLAFVAMPSGEPTEQQRAALARRYLGQPSDLPGAPNNQVCAWAFGGLTGPDAVSQRYGDGRKIYRA